MTEPDLLAIDESSRQRALEVASFIVEAPAGAGKTELLTQRYLRLLATVKEPEEIIAITFTNKAAAEMRARILNSLTAATQPVAAGLAPHKKITRDLSLAALARDADLGWQLLQNPARLRITTIDALSASLARQMPFLSRFGAQPAVSDDSASHYDAAALRTLALLEATGDDNREAAKTVEEALRYFHNDTARLQKLLVSMLERRDQWLGHIAAAEQNEGSAIAMLVASDLARAGSAVDASLQAQLMPIAQYAAGKLSAAGSDSPIKLLGEWDHVLEGELSELELWRSVASLLLTNTGTFRKRFDKNMGLPAEKDAKDSKPFKDSLAACIEQLQQTPGAEEALARIQQLPEPKLDAEEARIVGIFARLLRIAAAQLWAVFQQQREVDFIEIAQRALSALGAGEEGDEPSNLQLRLDYRISHLLVDEFQDTSPAQIELLTRLTAGWQAGDGRTLFIVGDPMQSIYRFRKADVGLFLQARESGIGGITLESLRLNRNNRSHPEVVDWINATFPEVFPPADNPQTGAVKFASSVATKPPLIPAPAVSKLAARGEGSLNTPLSLDGRGAGGRGRGFAEQSSVPPERASHAGASPGEGAAYSLGGVIVHPVLVADDAEDGNIDEAREVIAILRNERATHPSASIAILVRARSHLDALVTELQRSAPELRYQAVEIERLEDRQVIQDLLALTRALHHRGDRVNWLAALRAPWCGLTLPDLHMLAADDHHSTLWQLMNDETRIQQMSADGQQRLQHLRAVFAEALAQQGRLRTRRWVEAVWRMLGGEACLQDAAERADAEAYFRLIDQLDASGGFTLDRLGKEIASLYAEPDPGADNAAGNAGSPPIQIMTVHKSKGLEFDCVILPGLHRAPRNGDNSLLLWEEFVDGHGQEHLVIAPVKPRRNKDDKKPTAYDYLRTLDAEREANESSRVLYVAATRAIRSLHLVAATTVKVNEDSSPLSPSGRGAGGEGEITLKPSVKGAPLTALWPAVEADFNAALAQWQGSTQDAQDDNPYAEFVPTLTRLASPAIPAYLQGDEPSATAPLSPGGRGAGGRGRGFAEQSSVPSERASHAGASPAEGAAFTDVDGDVDTEDINHSLLADIGTLAHRTLELIAQDGLDQWSVDRVKASQAAFKRWLQGKGHAASALDDAATQVQAAVSNAIGSEAGRWVLAQRESAGNELALTSSQDGKAQPNIIDRTFVENGERWIIDYKTARFAPDTPESELKARAEIYRPQLERYAALFALEGLPIRKAIFYIAAARLVELDRA